MNLGKSWTNIFWRRTVLAAHTRGSRVGWQSRRKGVLICYRAKFGILTWSRDPESECKSWTLLWRDVLVRKDNSTQISIIGVILHCEDWVSARWAWYCESPWCRGGESCRSPCELCEKVVIFSGAPACAEARGEASVCGHVALATISLHRELSYRLPPSGRQNGSGLLLRKANPSGSQTAAVLGLRTESWNHLVCI